MTNLNLGDAQTVVIDIFPADPTGATTGLAFDAGSVTAILSDTVEAEVTVDASQTFVTVRALGPVDAAADALLVSGTVTTASGTVSLSGTFSFNVSAGAPTSIGFSAQ